MLINKILLVSYFYPPLATPRGTRWFHFANFLADKGIDLDVISVNPDGIIGIDNNMAEDINKRINIKYIENQLLKLQFWNKHKNNNSFFSFMSKLTYGIIRRVCYPDAQIFWAINVYRDILKSKKVDYDCILTVSNPISTLILGYLLRKKIKLYWVCDMGDPWSFNNLIGYKIIRSKLDKMLERKVIEKADKIVVTTDQTQSLFSNLYPNHKHKFFTITQGYDPSLFQNKKRSKYIDEKNLNIVYTGRLYGKHRNINEFLYALKELSKYCKDIKFIFAGITERDFVYKIKKLGLENNIDIIGYLPSHEIAILQKNADVLLHLGNNSLTQLPGKIFEYIGSGRPIFGIYYFAGDIGKEIIEKKSLGITCANDRDNIQESLKKIIDLWRKGQLKELRNEQTTGNFDWHSTAEQFYRLLTN